MANIVDATWEMKNITATNIRQYERGMPYLFFVKSETKPVETEIRDTEIEWMRTSFTDENSPWEIHDTDGGDLGGLPPWPHHVVVIGIVVCIQALRHWTNIVNIYEIIVNKEGLECSFEKAYTSARSRWLQAGC